MSIILKHIIKKITIFGNAAFACGFILYPELCNSAVDAPATWKPIQGFPKYGIIHNSLSVPDQKIALGVNQHGNLNTPPGSGTSANNTLTLNTNKSTDVCGFGNADGAVGIAYKYDGCSNGSCPTIRSTTCSKQLTTYEAGWYDGTSPGARWEGWGAGAVDSNYKKVYGFAFFGSEDPSKDLRNGTCVDTTSHTDANYITNGICIAPSILDNKESDLELKSFVVDSTSIKSTVWIRDSTGAPMLEVNHLYGPTAGDTNPILFQALVTITNISGGTLPEVRYRRVMDWDILNNAEKVNLDLYGVNESSNSDFKPKIYEACDNGGSSNSGTPSNRGVKDSALNPNPFLNCKKIANPINADIANGVDAAKSGNLGSSFNFSFGEMACNESSTFYIYYGAAPSRDAIKEAFNKVGATIYSLGYQSGNQNKTEINYQSTEPNLVYGFGFKGLSGSSIAPVLPSKVASLPAGSSTLQTNWQTYAPPILVNGNLYQALFKYQKDKQWIGEIKKYKLDSSGSISNMAPVLASTSLLNRIYLDNRSIWTVGYDPNCQNSTAIQKSNQNNNFVIGNVESLKYALFNCSENIDIAAASDIINFTRGMNSNGEGYGKKTDPRFNDKNETSSLGDVYHSELVYVGQPNAPISSDEKLFGNSEAYYRNTNGYQKFATDNANRSPRIYVGANDGMLHAFDLDLNEKWAFIPPSVLPILRNKISSNGISTNGGDGKSNSIFTVDGPIAVKDVYVYDNDEGKAIWKTLLIGGLGWGGNGYYSLDITNPDKPKHLFTINNDVQNKIVNYWDRSGQKTDIPYQNSCPNFDYSKLGGAWSRPVIMLLPYKNANESISNKWVAVFGGGFSGGSSVSSSNSNSAFGSNVYIIDLEPNADITTSCLKNNKYVLTSTGGHVLKNVTVDQDSTTGIPNGVTANLTVVTGDGTSLANYKGGIAYFTDLQSTLWKLNLTNIGAQFQLIKRASSQSNYDNDRLGFNQVATTIISGDKKRLFNFFGTGDQTRLQRRVSTIVNRIYGIADNNFTSFSIEDNRIATPQELDANQCSVNQSWFSNISNLTGFKQGTDFQKVVGRAAVSNGNVVFTAYQPEYSSCPKYGTSRLIQISNNCVNSGGASLIGPGLTTQPTMDSRGNIYVGLSNLDPTVANRPAYLVDNIAKIKIDTGTTVGKVKFKSWREKRAY